MYTINNFLEIKKEIYEYCTNLTVSRTNGFIIRHKNRADDLFHNVYLKSYEDLPKIKKQIIDKLNYIQIIKNITFWVYISRYNQKLAGNKVLCNLDYYQDSSKSEFLLESKKHEEPKVFQDIFNHPDFKFFTRNLKELDIQIIKLTIEGYTKTEIIKKFNITYNRFYLVFEKVSLNSVEKSKPIKIKRESVNELEFLEFKIGKIKLKELKLKQRHIKLYALYLQGYEQSYISKLMNKSKAQIGQEIYRIKNKLKQINDTNRS